MSLLNNDWTDTLISITSAADSLSAALLFKRTQIDLSVFELTQVPQIATVVIEFEHWRGHYYLLSKRVHMAAG